MLIIDCILLSAGAGLVYGLFGSGSGLIMMPGYFYLLHHFNLAQEHRMQIAIATTSTASAILGFVSARVQWKANCIKVQNVIPLIPGLFIGTILAVALLNIVTSHLLKQLFAFVVILVSFWLWFYNQDKDNNKWLLTGVFNFFRTFLMGLLWFLLGIAVFTVPYLHKCGIKLKYSIGAATIVGSVFSAIAATLLILTGIFKIGISWTQLGYVNLPLLAISLIPSSLTGHYASKLSHKLPAPVMKKVYAALILTVGLLMI